MVFNSETHSWHRYRNLKTVGCSALNEASISHPPPRLRDQRAREDWKTMSQKPRRITVKQCLLDIMAACLNSAQLARHKMTATILAWSRKDTQTSTPTGELMSWWLWDRQSQLSLRVWSLVGVTLSSWWPRTKEYVGSGWVIKQKEEGTKLGQ